MPRSLRLISPLALLLSVAVATPASAQLRARQAKGLDRATQAQRVFDLLGPEHLLREAWGVVKRRVYKQEALPNGWEEIRDRYLEEVAKARTPREAHAVINRMLGEAKLSHLVLMEREVFIRELWNEFREQPVVRLGCELVQLPQGFFVGGLCEGSPAAEAGLLEGDQVLAINGIAVRKSDLLQPAGHDPGLPGPPGWVVAASAEAELVVTIRREAGGPTQPLTVKPRPTSQLEAIGRSARVVDVEGTKVGVIRVWHVMTRGVLRTVREALEGPLQDADALVLDLRGRGGRSDVAIRIINLFRPPAASWKKPVVGLIDGQARSAKEIMAWSWKQLKVGPLLGEKTAGAVIGTYFQQLSDGSILLVPAQDVTRLTRGENLEGVGVAPTEPVEQLPLPFRAGRDAILSAGLERAAELAQPAAPARRQF